MHKFEQLITVSSYLHGAIGAFVVRTAKPSQVCSRILLFSCVELVSVDGLTEIPSSAIQ